VLNRGVRANLVYRQFTRAGAWKAPDAKTLGKFAVALGAEIIVRIHQRVVAIAREREIIRARRLRLDTTHWPRARYPRLPEGCRRPEYVTYRAMF
jgi:transposase, IS5 family